MNDQNKKTKEEKETPIIDGDTRPDKGIEPEVKSSLKKDLKEKALTKERGADINTLEDYKDAK